MIYLYCQDCHHMQQSKERWRFCPKCHSSMNDFENKKYFEEFVRECLASHIISTNETIQEVMNTLKGFIGEE